jgi:hypothetical protein
VSEEAAPERIAIVWSPEARAFFDHTGASAIEITAVRHRREAYG